MASRSAYLVSGFQLQQCRPGVRQVVVPGRRAAMFGGGVVAGRHCRRRAAGAVDHAHSAVDHVV